MRSLIIRRISDLLETEEIDPRHVQEVATAIVRLGAWTSPICIERRMAAVMDGHHRLAAAQVLGLVSVPTVSYEYSEVELTAWRNGFDVRPSEVLRRAMDHDLYPAKTTRHVFPNGTPVSLVPLACLRSDDGFRQHIEWVWDGKEPPHGQKPGGRYRPVDVFDRCKSHRTALL